MPEWTDRALVVAAVACAAWYVARRLWRHMRSARATRPGHACAPGACGCEQGTTER